MSEMDEFYVKLQMLLMKKIQEYGALRFINSRATNETATNVENLCSSIKEIFDKYDLTNEEAILQADPRYTQAFKYLMLNTSFTAQERLAEDIVNGYLVDMCPPLSPYLFVQILWDLKYEEILTESILYIPLDLCNEILEITRTCIKGLNFERAMNIIFRLILNAYKKIVTLKNIGSQSTDLDGNAIALVANFQELLTLLLDKEIVHSSAISDLNKYKRYGILLKSIMRVTKQCIESARNDARSADVEKLYKVTFGKDPFLKCDEIVISSMLNTLNQELMNLLLKKMKEIDCNIYFAWVEFDDVEFPQISLQRSIGNDCYYFMEFLRKNDNLPKDNHLLECLQQLSSQPDPNASTFGSVLTLDELSANIENGNKENLKELVCRYREWNRSTLSIVNANKESLDKRDCLNLLEYLNLVFTKSDKEIRQHVYVVIMKILCSRSVPDMYEIIVDHLIRHDARNTLESHTTERSFNDFIATNANLRSPKNLKAVLLFLLRNPKKTLTSLLNITIGHPKYNNIIISAADTLLLSPFLSIKIDDKNILLTDCLRAICAEDVEWSTKKLMDFVDVMLNNRIVQVDELINNVFIPYLEGDTFNAPNTRCVCSIIRKLEGRYWKTRNTNVKGLLVSLAKRMSFLRKQTKLSKYVVDEALTDLIRTTKLFVNRDTSVLGATTRKLTIEGIVRLIEPIDRQYFAPLWRFAAKGINVLEIVQDYERKCIPVINRLKEDPKTSTKLRSYLDNLGLLRGDFLRHLILRVSTEEYWRIGFDATLLHWFALGWEDALDGYDNFVRLTVEACCISLEHPSLAAKNTFVFLLKSLLSFTIKYKSLKDANHSDYILDALGRNTRLLHGSIKHSSYSFSYDRLLVRMNNTARQDPASDLLQELLGMLEDFSQECSQIEYTGIPLANLTAKIKRLRAPHDFISACIELPNAEVYECITRMDCLFFPD